jgi:Domain of unknown function (DUF4340)
MSPKVFLGLLVVTLITSVAAVATALREPSAAPVHYGDQPAFTALRANPDAVAKVTLTTPDGTFTLVRETGDRWAALERFGYTVDSERVRKLIVTLADMRLIEAKTRLPERYGRIEVEDVGSKDAKSRLLRLESADGKVLAEAILGKEQHRLTGSQPSGTYLRHPGEAQSWLASGGVEIDPKVVDWLQTEVVDLAPDRIQRIEIQPASGTGYAAARDAEGAPLHLLDLASDETPKKDTELARLASAFSGVQLEDVKPRSDLKWPAVHHTAKATTFDGVEVTAQLAEIDGDHWAIFDARDVGAAAPANAAQPPAAAAAPANAGQQPADTATASDTGAAAKTASTSAGSTSPGDKAEAKSTPETPKPTAAEINRRVSRWAYKLSGSVLSRLTAPRSEWLKNAGTS